MNRASANGVPLDVPHRNVTRNSGSATTAYCATSPVSTGWNAPRRRPNGRAFPTKGGGPGRIARFAAREFAAPSGFARPPPAPALFLESLAVSTAVVALGEIGDKTQLLALLLAARYRRPWPIAAGILVATLANHALAGLAGNWVRALVSPDVLRWVLAASFFAVAIWALIPDKLDDAAAPVSPYGVFVVTTLAFFLAEMGDKTQIATVMLAAKFPSLAAVVLGTTLGMLIANVPVLFAAKLLSGRIPFRLIRILAALVFAALGVWVLVQGVPAG